MGDDSVMEDWNDVEFEAHDAEADGKVSEDRVQYNGGQAAARVLPEPLVKLLELDLSVWPKKSNREKRIKI